MDRINHKKQMRRSLRASFNLRHEWSMIALSHVITIGIDGRESPCLAIILVLNII